MKYCKFFINVHVFSKGRECGVLYTGLRTLTIYDQFVHSSWTQSCPNCISNKLTSVNVADELRNTLRGVCPLLEQNYTRLLSK